MVGRWSPFLSSLREKTQLYCWKKNKERRMATCIVISYSALIGGMTTSILLIVFLGGKQMANSHSKMVDKRNALMRIESDWDRERERLLWVPICLRFVILLGFVRDPLGQSTRACYPQTNLWPTTVRKNDQHGDDQPSLFLWLLRLNIGRGVAISPLLKKNKKNGGSHLPTPFSK